MFLYLDLLWPISSLVSMLMTDADAKERPKTYTSRKSRGRQVVVLGTGQAVSVDAVAVN